MEGTFPAPVKLSPRVNVWRVEDVRRWIELSNRARSGQTGGSLWLSISPIRRRSRCVASVCCSLGNYLLGSPAILRVVAIRRFHSLLEKLLWRVMTVMDNEKKKWRWGGHAARPRRDATAHRGDAVHRDWSAHSCRRPSWRWTRKAPGSDRREPP